MVDGPLVVHELVTLVVGKCVKFIVLGILHDLVGFHHLGLVRLPLWISELLQHVFSHDLLIQLGFSLAVQAESSDFTFYLSLVSTVPMIFWAPGNKFHNAVIAVHLIGEVPEKVSKDGVL